MYSRDEVFNASLKYFNGDELAANVFFKYCLQDKDGNYLELIPDDMHKRLAKEFARIELKYPNPMSEEEIYGYFKGFRFMIPQGSPMSAIGNKHKVQSAGNCFVIEKPYDSYGGILKTDQELAQLMKRRAGVGVCIDSIRPKGMHTNNAANTTDGIAVFMERFSSTCREVAQGGRRGAELQCISVHHPEIYTFINIKKDKTKVTGANLSVKLTDEFLNAVEGDEDFQIRWPVDNKVNPVVSEMISARQLWDDMVESAWLSAEPGLLFEDSIIKNSTADIYSGIDDAWKTTATNPCGEIPLGKDSCRLLLLNLISFVNKPFTQQANFNFKLFKDMSSKAQRLMDDMIDLELEIMGNIIDKIKSDPEPEHVKKIELDLWVGFRRTCGTGRRTGLGITALGDTLAALGVRYGSERAIKETEKIYKTLALAAHHSSCILAKERGAFPIFDFDLENNADCPYIKRIWAADKNIYKMTKKYGRRNIALTTTAPAGSVSCLTQTTSGIEPVYLIKYKRRKKVTEANEEVVFTDDLGDNWTEYDVFHRGFKEWMYISGKKNIKDSPYYKATSNDIDWVNKIKMQAAAQKWISHSISNTTNLPKTVSKDVVSDVYMAGWKSGCKGVTVYVDGSRDGVLISSDEGDKNIKLQYIDATKRPEKLNCDIHQVSIKGEKWTILVGLLDGKPYEVFGGLSDLIEIPKKYIKGDLTKRVIYRTTGIYDLAFGDDGIIKNITKVFDNPTHQVLTRMVSLSLRHGARPSFLCEQLLKDPDNDLTSFSKVLSRIIKKYIADGTEVTSDKECPQCKSVALVYQEGCKICVSCGASACQ